MLPPWFPVNMAPAFSKPSIFGFVVSIAASAVLIRKYGDVASGADSRVPKLFVESTNQSKSKEKVAVDGLFLRRVWRLLKIMCPGVITPEFGFAVLVAGMLVRICVAAFSLWGIMCGKLIATSRMCLAHFTCAVDCSGSRNIGRPRIMFPHCIYGNKLQASCRAPRTFPQIQTLSQLLPHCCCPCAVVSYVLRSLDDSYIHIH